MLLRGVVAVRNAIRSVLMRILTTFLLAASMVAAKLLPKLKVSDNQRFIATSDGKPSFHLADAAWELFHRL